MQRSGPTAAQIAAAAHAAALRRAEAGEATTDVDDASATEQEKAAVAQTSFDATTDAEAAEVVTDAASGADSEPVAEVVPDAVPVADGVDSAPDAEVVPDAEPVAEVPADAEPAADVATDAEPVVAEPEPGRRRPSPTRAGRRRTRAGGGCSSGPPQARAGGRPGGTAARDGIRGRQQRGRRRAVRGARPLIWPPTTGTGSLDSRCAHRADVPCRKREPRQPVSQRALP